MQVQMPVIAKVDSVPLSKVTMEKQNNSSELADPQDLLRLLKDIFASDLTPLQAEKVKNFLAGKGALLLSGKKYTKDDLKDLFYSQN